MPATAPIRVPKYCRREPEKEPLYQILAGHLETFVQQARTSEHRLPLHVEKEMRAYLECGMLAYGFVRARCEDCGTSRAIAFSCKRRGFCPSYSGRRMADTAARLADDVLPRVPVRPWVLSFPYEIRYRLAYDGELVATVLAVFLCVVGRWYRRQAQALGHDSARCGSVTFVQRFGSSLNLNPHLHVLMLDGVYVDGDEAPVFVPAPPLSDQDVQQIVQTSTRRILRLCAKRGLLDRHRSRSAADEEPVLAALMAASVGGLLATGERAGQPRATCPERCGHRGAYGALVRCLARLFAACGDPRPQPCGHRLGWAALLARVFAAELSQCAACGGRLKIIAALTDPASIRRYLEGVGLPARPPSMAPPRAPPPAAPFEFAA